MIDPSTLPNFASDGYESHKIELDLETLVQCLPEDREFLWLESHQDGQRILLLDSLWSISAYTDKLIYTINGQKQQIDLEAPIAYRTFLNELESTWLAKQPDFLKLAWALSYEAGWNEEVQRQNKPKSSTPELWCACPKIIITQELNQTKATVTQAKGSPKFSLTSVRSISSNYAKEVKLKTEENTKSYLEKIVKVKQHIRAGDSFQVNLSRGFEAEGELDLFSWAYHAFKKQASSFGAFLHTSEFSILSLSPERLIAGEGEQLITRPIAGTLPVIENEDPARLKAFKEHPKELSEHNMLIDLERNDLGKVSQAGSVVVEEYLTIETLPHVHHLVSQVVGKRQDQQQFGDILFALFPGGTITGCPKLETMHIIDALEAGPRSFYTGSLGYLSQQNFDGNILIRTALYQQGQLQMRFGGGLVWDSDPDKEVLETFAKARGLIQSLLEGGADFDSDHRSLRQFFS